MARPKVPAGWLSSHVVKRRRICRVTEKRRAAEIVGRFRRRTHLAEVAQAPVIFASENNKLDQIVKWTLDYQPAHSWRTKEELARVTRICLPVRFRFFRI